MQRPLRTPDVLDKNRDLRPEEFDEEEWTEADPRAGEVEGAEPRKGQAEGKPKKVRPIQMGEVLRKYIGKRLLEANKSDVDRTMISARQFGCGLQGGAEGIQHFFQLLHET